MGQKSYFGLNPYYLDFLRMPCLCRPPLCGDRTKNMIELMKVHCRMRAPCLIDGKNEYAVRRSVRDVIVNRLFGSAAFRKELGK